jgi:hypothetical protein
MVFYATAHTANYFIDVLNEVFEDRLMSHRLWHTRCPELNPSDFYLWGNIESKVYSDNPHILDVHKHNVCKSYFC